MQVTLTPHAAELLQEAMMRRPGEPAENIVEQALALQASQSRGHPKPTGAEIWEKLKSIPGLRVPDHWPPHFDAVEPVKVEGEAVSQQLVRERR